MSNDNKITLEQLFRFFRGLPHQTAAISELEADIKANGYDIAMVRNRPWFKTWSQAGKVPALTAARQLITEFEGFAVKAYPDPLSGGAPWTIGFGATQYSNGQPVKEGDVITLEQADALLQDEIEAIATKLGKSVPFWREMSEEQQSALVSFAYNLGPGFYGTSGFETITRVLKDKEWSKVPDALMLYRNPGSNVEAGLRRRREAEGAVWLLGKPKLQLQQEPGRVRPKDPFSSLLTPHVTLGEFALNQEARRFDHQYQVDTAAELAAFLERVRIAFGGKPIIITSGYRPPAVNRSVGGASSSEHLFNAPLVGACDFYVKGADIYKVQEWCDNNWPYSLGYGAPKGFVHLGIRGTARPKVRWDY